VIEGHPLGSAALLSLLIFCQTATLIEKKWRDRASLCHAIHAIDYEAIATAQTLMGWLAIFLTRSNQKNQFPAKSIGR
jgi:hypothetical protein